MKKKFLFLDDMQERHDELDKMTKNTFSLEVIHVYTADEAIAELDKGDVDIASLDHDLSIDSIMTEPELGAKSGYDVAMHIANMPKDKLPRGVIVHSWNPGGAQRMVSALSGVVNAVYLPFKAGSIMPPQTDF
jgi:hypothetical protein